MLRERDSKLTEMFFRCVQLPLALVVTLLTKGVTQYDITFTQLHVAAKQRRDTPTSTSTFLVLHVVSFVILHHTISKKASFTKSKHTRNNTTHNSCCHFFHSYAYSSISSQEGIWHGDTEPMGITLADVCLEARENEARKIRTVRMTVTERIQVKMQYMYFTTKYR